MAVQLILKNSSIEDKRPTAAQLANGELSINYNEAGPFIACKDTAGNIQSLGGVKFSDDAPADPPAGAWWFNTAVTQLYVFDGNTWQSVGGGGGGGGGISAVIGGEGVDASYSGSTVTIDVDLAGARDGLEFDNGQLKATTASKNDFGSVSIGDNVDVSSSGEISIAIATTSKLGVVKIGNGIDVDLDGTISVDIPQTLNYRGSCDLSLSPTGQISPNPPELGDAYVNDKTTNAINAGWTGLSGGSTAGDLVVWDGTEWELIETGGDSLWDRTGTILSPSFTGDKVQTASTVASDPDTTLVTKDYLEDQRVTTSNTAPAAGDSRDGDLWWNTNDGRLYVYYTDADSSQWVDASPENSEPPLLPDPNNPTPQPGTLDDRYVNVVGDNMTGSLTLGTNPASPNISLNADGSAAFSRNVVSGGEPGQGLNDGVKLGANGFISISRTNSSDTVFNTYVTGRNTKNIEFFANGSSTFAADATINGVTVGLGGGSVTTNTAVGNDALLNNTTGYNNTALGRTALVANTTGENNTAVGRAALRSSTEGDFNTALGQKALFNNTEGDFNTALGGNTLYNNTTGSYNTTIGLEAGYYIEGSNNTILGAYKGTAADATLSDTVIISAGKKERMRIDSSGDVKIGGTLPSAPNITLKADGTITAKVGAILNTGGYANQGALVGATATQGGIYYSGGNLGITSPQTSKSIVIQDDVGGSTVASIVCATGAASFAGDVKIGGTLPSAPNISLNADGNATFAGTVTADNVTFNLEADDDTKYTSTTDAEGNETRVYNGEVLDVKELLLTLQTAAARIATLEAKVQTLENYS